MLQDWAFADAIVEHCCDMDMSDLVVVLLRSGSDLGSTDKDVS